jgi:signal transduction histidine kinase
MISELLEFTRGAQTSVAMSECAYGEFVRRLVKDIRDEIHDTATAIEFENAPPEVTILADPNRLSHVFYNLIHNAVDAMPDGGRIRIRFQEEPDQVVTEIEDSGPGIAAEILPCLFEPFATHGKSRGSGLGLSICKKIIDDHRGRISARNEANRGAVFAFSLLRAAAAPKP